MKKKISMFLLAVAALLALSLGAVACGGDAGENEISVIFHGTSDVTVTADAGDTIDPPADPQKTGYTFAGWFIDAALTDPFDAEKTYSENFEVWAKFTANTDTPYTVKHLQQDVAGDGYTEVTADRENKTGTTDTQTTAAAKAYEGFTAQTVTQANIAGDGSTVVEIRYDRNTFDVTLVNGTENKTIEGVRYGASAAVLYADENVPAKQGYAFAGWYTSENAKVEETAVLTAAATYTAQFTANTDTPYKVEYYLEALDGSYAIAAEETQNLTGTTDATVQAQPKSIGHYTFDENNAGNVTSGTVAADGSLILKLYYTRNLYTITFKNGEAVLGEPQSVKYGALPVYMGETPEKAATSEFVYLFKDFGSVVPAAADAEYSAQYYEVKNYSGYVFTEVFTLPDVTAAFAGAELKQYIDDTEIAAGEQSAAAGSHVWKIAVMNGADEVSSAQMNIEVCTDAEYWANYGSGDTDQFADRFFVDADSQITFGFEYLDEDVYGVGSAYHYSAAGVHPAWNQRIQLIALADENADNVSVYQTLEFDVWQVSGTPSFSFLVIGEGVNTTVYADIKIADADGNEVPGGNTAAGQWYHCTVQLPFSNDGLIDFTKLYLVLTEDNQTADLYLRDFRFEEKAELQSGGDFFDPCNASLAEISLAGQEEEIDFGGRKNVYKYVSTGATWDSRIQFSRAALEQWNAYAETEENYALTMEVYFTGSLNSLYLRPINVSGVAEFYTSNQTYVKIYDPNGAAVTTPAAGVWYTIEVDIGALGVLGYSATNNDIGLQIAANASNATFYIGGVGFAEKRPAPEPLQWVPDYFVSMSGSGGSITYAAEGGGRTDVYKYTSAKSAWESRVQFTQAALARYNELRTAAGGKLVFDVYLESPLGSIQFWAPGGKANTAAFTSGDTAYVTIKAEDGEVAGEIASGVWYTVEIDIAALGELTSGGVDCGLQMAANSNSGGTFYIDSIRFEAAA